MGCCTEKPDAKLDVVWERKPKLRLDRREVLAGSAGLAGLAMAGGVRRAAAQETVKLAFCGQLLCVVPYEVTQATGLFAEQGLDVELVYTRGGNAAMQALVGGAVDYAGTSFDVALQAYAQGAGVGASPRPAACRCSPWRWGRQGRDDRRHQGPGRHAPSPSRGSAMPTTRCCCTSWRRRVPTRPRWRLRRWAPICSMRCARPCRRRHGPGAGADADGRGRRQVAGQLHEYRRRLPSSRRPLPFMGVAVAQRSASSGWTRCASWRRRWSGPAAPADHAGRRGARFAAEELIAGGDRPQLESIIERYRGSLYPDPVTIDVAADERVAECASVAGILKPEVDVHGCSTRGRAGLSAPPRHEQPRPPTCLPRGTLRVRRWSGCATSSCARRRAHPRGRDAERRRGPVRQPGRAFRLGQEHDPARGDGPAAARGGHASSWMCRATGSACCSRTTRCCPGARPGRTWRWGCASAACPGRGARRGRWLARAAGPCRLRRSLSAPAERRPAQAGGAGAGAGAEAVAAADGRAVRLARRHRPPPHHRRAARLGGAREPHGAAGDPRPRGGANAVGRRLSIVARAPRPHPPPLRGADPAAARSRPLAHASVLRAAPGAAVARSFAEVDGGGPPAGARRDGTLRPCLGEAADCPGGAAAALGAWCRAGLDRPVLCAGAQPLAAVLWSVFADGSIWDTSAATFSAALLGPGRASSRRRCWDSPAACSRSWPSCSSR